MSNGYHELRVFLPTSGDGSATGNRAVVRSNLSGNLFNYGPSRIGGASSDVPGYETSDGKDLLRTVCEISTYATGRTFTVNNWDFVKQKLEKWGINTLGFAGNITFDIELLKCSSFNVFCRNVDGFAYNGIVAPNNGVNEEERWSVLCQCHYYSNNSGSNWYPGYFFNAYVSLSGSGIYESAYTNYNLRFPIVARNYLPIYSTLFENHYATATGGYPRYLSPYGITDVYVVTGAYIPTSSNNYNWDSLVSATLPAPFRIARHYAGMRFENRQDAYVYQGTTRSIAEEFSADFPDSKSYPEIPFRGLFSVQIDCPLRLAFSASWTPSGGNDIQIKMCADTMSDYGEEPYGWLEFKRGSAAEPWNLSRFVVGDTITFVARSILKDPAEALATPALTAVIPISRDTDTEIRLVNFDPNGGDLAEGLREKLVFVGEPYGSLPTPTRPYHLFKGWFTAPDGGTQVLPDTIVPAQE